ncbi:MAG: hypothetical protein KatS3mg068_0939 [Candidatus Sericytochromatia bacterium]|nr:MAG: hypothetical protein KatS3mg068_0939 [Candidatus Sericytochromatia bacterium]
MVLYLDLNQEAMKKICLKKLRKLALASALSSEKDKITIISGDLLLPPKTKEFVNLLKKLDLEKV